MIIDKRYMKKAPTHYYYYVCNDATETAKEVTDIARFTDLLTATLVLKFIRGDKLSEADTEKVKQALANMEV